MFCKTVINSDWLRCCRQPLPSWQGLLRPTSLPRPPWYEGARSILGEARLAKEPQQLQGTGAPKPFTHPCINPPILFNPSIHSPTCPPLNMSIWQFSQTPGGGGSSVQQCHPPPGGDVEEHQHRDGAACAETGVWRQRIVGGEEGSLLRQVLYSPASPAWVAILPLIREHFCKDTLCLWSKGGGLCETPPTFPLIFSWSIYNLGGGDDGQILWFGFCNLSLMALFGAGQLMRNGRRSIRRCSKN